MAYASAADMVARFGERQLVNLTDINEPRLDAIDEVVVTTALEDATRLIDGYLVGRHALPLAEPPEVLKVHCCAIARYLLMTAQPDDRARQDYKAACDYLTRVAAGSISLMPPAQAQTPAGLGPVVFHAGRKVFGREESE